MNNEQLLKGFEYSVIAQPKKSSKGYSPDAEVQPPLLHVRIDFGKGRFCLKADWQYIIDANEIVEKTWNGLHSDRIEINLTVYPGGIINLANFENDGGILFLEGKLNDEWQSNSCTGMLIFSRNILPRNNFETQWYIIFYLYEYQNAFVEYKFKFPIYLDSFVYPTHSRFSNPR